jgi:predicted  nucleic acid-binding Zn-ribbon protein
MLEVSMHRQLNFIARHNKAIKEIDEKLQVLNRDIKEGKKSFFYNPKAEFEKLSKRKAELEDELREPRRDLKIARLTYSQISEERERNSPTKIIKLNYKDESFFEEREHAFKSVGQMKQYFTIEHLVH